MMAKTSAIGWTDGTWNPWMGCTKVSPGCANCYAEAENKRYGRSVWGHGVPRQRTSEAYWKKPIQWNKECAATGKRMKVFPSWCDPFDAEVPWQWRRDFFELIQATPKLDWLLVTKRAKEMYEFFTENFPPHVMPIPENMWLGVTVENQQTADERIPYLLMTGSKTGNTIKFLSVEPMLESIDISVALNGTDYETLCAYSPVDWVICGGESGHHARPFKLEWARKLRNQCEEHQTWFFMKQLGSNAFHEGKPVITADMKGGDISEWPTDLRVQETPVAVKR